MEWEVSSGWLVTMHSAGVWMTDLKWLEDGCYGLNLSCTVYRIQITFAQHMQLHVCQGHRVFFTSFAIGGIFSPVKTKPHTASMPAPPII